jgi:hypothetical protein
MNKAAFIALIALFGAAIATDQSYVDAQAEQDHTEEMVCMGYWPPEVAEFELDCSDYGGRHEFRQ